MNVTKTFLGMLCSIVTVWAADITPAQIREEQPVLWAAVENLDGAVARIDRLTAEVNHRSGPGGSGLGGSGS